MEEGSNIEAEPGAAVEPGAAAGAEEIRVPCDTTFELKECRCAGSPQENELNRWYIRTYGAEKFDSIYQRSVSYLEEYLRLPRGINTSSSRSRPRRRNVSSKKNRSKAAVEVTPESTPSREVSTLSEIVERQKGHRLTRHQKRKSVQSVDTVSTTSCHRNQKEVILERIFIDLDIPVINRDRLMNFITDTISDTEAVSGSNRYRNLKQADYLLIKTFLKYLGLDIIQILDPNDPTVSSINEDIMRKLFLHPLVLEKILSQSDNTWPIIQTLSGRRRPLREIGLVLEELNGWDSRWDVASDDETAASGEPSAAKAAPVRDVIPIDQGFIDYMKRLTQTVKFLHEINNCRVGQNIEDPVNNINKRNDMFFFLSKNPNKLQPFVLTEKGELKSDDWNDEVIHWANLLYNCKICVGPLSNGKCYLMPIYSVRTAWGQSGRHTFYYAYTSNHVIELELREMLDYMREIPCIPVINQDKMKILFSHMFFNPEALKPSLGNSDASKRWLDQNIANLKWRNLIIRYDISVIDGIRELISSIFSDPLNIVQASASKKGGKTNKRKSRRRSNKRKGRKSRKKI